jgi:hypothetical protein
VSDILDQADIGRHVSHGDVDGAMRAIQFFLDTPQEQLQEMGERALEVLTARFTQAYLCTMFCDRLERALRMESTHENTVAPLVA